MKISIPLQKKQYVKYFDPKKTSYENKNLSDQIKINDQK